MTISGNSIFASDRCSVGVVVFPKSANGPVLPVRAIAGNRTGLGNPGYLKVFDGSIYVSDGGSSRVQVFPLNANGNVAPTRSIGGARTSPSGFHSVFVF